jgi:hypothetical protein
MNVILRHEGGVAEWLGRGLQSPVQRFDSARRLDEPFWLRFVTVSVSNRTEFRVLAHARTPAVKIHRLH